MQPSYTSQFKKDLKRMKKMGKKIEKIKVVMTIIADKKDEEDLITDMEFTQKYKNHKLSGTYSDRWECHVESDWLLVYKIDTDEVIFERTGTHSHIY